MLVLDGGGCSRRADNPGPQPSGAGGGEGGELAASSGVAGSGEPLTTHWASFPLHPASFSFAGGGLTLGVAFLCHLTSQRRHHTIGSFAFAAATAADILLCLLSSGTFLKESPTSGDRHFFMNARSALG